MAEPPSKIPDIGQLLLNLGRNGHAAYSVWTAAVLDDALDRLLTLYMPKLSKNLHKKLFTGYGPLSSFSARIDIAYSLDLITAVLSKDLHVIRVIRNEFAHSAVRTHLHTDQMGELLKKFSDYDPKKDRLVYYFDKFEECHQALKTRADAQAMSDALRKYKPGKADTSLEKSQ